MPQIINLPQYTFFFQLFLCTIYALSGRYHKKGGPQYTQISTISLYEYIKIRHDILIQCHWNYMKIKKIFCMLEIDILRNSSQNRGVLTGAFQVFRCPKKRRTSG